ncbi:exosortase/archaeosortase family protein [Algibacter sp.]|nr:exosortase/archaeosortase family protein [Algibacter sp.]
MSLLIRLKTAQNKIPKQIRLFLGKAFLFFVVWKLIYNVFLYDAKYLDRALTAHVGNASVTLINSLGAMNGFVSKREMTDNDNLGILKDEVSVIYHNDKVVLNIANVCNGLELMILYIGFIICMPSTFFRKLLYIILGLIVLDGINIVRCVGLIYLREYYAIYFQFAHHYLFNAMVYTGTFIMWIMYCRKIQFKNETP